MYVWILVCGLPYQPVPNTTHSNASYSLPAVIVRAAPPRLQDLVGIGGLGPGPGAGLSSGVYLSIYEFLRRRRFGFAMFTGRRHVRYGL